MNPAWKDPISSTTSFRSSTACATPNKASAAALLHANESSDVVEDDITQMYANWFIETCRLGCAYIGALIGYTPVPTPAKLAIRQTRMPRSSAGSDARA